jgi:hypothetical protein
VSTIRRALATLLPALAAICAATGAAGASTPVARATTHCRDIGPPGTDVGLYHVVASHITCGRARRVLNRWYHDASAPDSGPVGWHCRTHAAGPISYRVRCARGHARIAFTEYSD